MTALFGGRAVSPSALHNFMLRHDALAVAMTLSSSDRMRTVKSAKISNDQLSIKRHSKRYFEIKSLRIIKWM